MRSVDSSAAELLEQGLDPRRVRVERALLDELVVAAEAWPEAPRGEGIDETARPLLRLVLLLAHRAETGAEGIYALRGRFGEFNRGYARAAGEEERREHVLKLAEALGADRRTLRGDRRAFARWFGRDAVADRYLHRHAAEERRLAFTLERLGCLAGILLARSGGDDPTPLWRRLELERVALPLLAYDGDHRVRLAAFRALASAVRGLPRTLQEGAVGDATLQYIYRSALRSRQQAWVQCEALGLLESLSPRSLRDALSQRLGRGAEALHEGDDLFVRRFAVGLLGANLQRLPDLHSLLVALLDDPSPAVRQRLPAALRGAPPARVLPLLGRLALEDGEPSVRAAALLELPLQMERAGLFEGITALLGRVLDEEADDFVLRVALKVAVEGIPCVDGTHWSEALLPAIHRLHQTACVPVRRWAGEAREWFWLHADGEAHALFNELAPRFAAIRLGRGARPPSLKGVASERLARVLSLIVRNDFGAELEPALLGSKVRRGERSGFRLWRLLHELRHPSPDKRQAHGHTGGRVYHGLTHAPSAILGELAETKVPGEPLHLAEEGGWRPYLPLVDQAISTLDQGWPTKPLTIVTAQGVTELEPPHGPLGRLLARARLTFGFLRFARLRNWREGHREPPAEYARALESLGFRLRFRPHAGADGEAWPEDPMVRRFFPAALVLPSWEELRRRGEEYFFSVYENTLFHLVLFTAAASGWFLGRHIWANQRMKRARTAIPLVIGGWGTRGKSGTERLKAALFNALGYGVVSKTTGCEAMFLHAHPFGRLREMFLFRPYDKATIWEQVNVVRLSAKLKSDVFLWECMGLTPSYVYILQRHWMRDDLSTITNTYPDHEDLQGPAGHDIPRVMTNFIPARSTLITSEEQMLPILREGAREVATGVVPVGWLEAGLLPPDILSRFPYEEHPYNIALVLAMAAELGIDADFALKEMADRVVADLGVLKTYPTSTIDGRELEFVMGMSANERLGAMGNWTRMGFDRHAIDIDPATWVVTVVNNRADRVPRSKVFASMLVKEVSADRHLLIGNNLQGLRGYIREAWEEEEGALALFDGELDGELDARAVLERTARRLRVPLDESQVARRRDAMLDGLGIDSPEGCEEAATLSAFIDQDREAMLQYRALVERIEGGERGSGLERDFRAQAWRWFERTLVVVEEYHATGNQVIRRIVEATPPGLHARILGMQNIKGTGLDYVYRWQAWESCHAACGRLEDDDPARSEEGLRELAQFQGYGPLCELRVRECVERVRHRPHAQREEFQAELGQILSNLDRALADAALADARSGEGGGLISGVLEAIEAFLDAGDAVRRRKRADRIYRDLADQRISHDRAAVELQALNKRQKGGWLMAGVSRWLKREAR